jgi:endonuclease YncB( thermonuclease family)
MSRPRSAVASPTVRVSAMCVLIAFYVSIANAAPVDCIEVLDGDTIRVAGETFRLVGFDAPETYRAQCPSERALGNRATFRLRQIVAAGGLDLERVACACRAGTEGTMGCNYGRSCGVLRAGGQDVGTMLIAEGLARPYVCGRTSCPARGRGAPLQPTRRARRHGTGYRGAASGGGRRGGPRPVE